MKIMFVINSLNVGGAERMLVKLANHDVFAKDDIIVVSLISNGALAHALAGKITGLCRLACRETH